jgi:hypothetical protein
MKDLLTNSFGMNVFNLLMIVNNPSGINGVVTIGTFETYDDMDNFWRENYLRNPYVFYQPGILIKGQLKLLQN